MFKPSGCFGVIFIASVSVFIGCQKVAEKPAWVILTDKGPAAWDTSGTAGVAKESYNDRGAAKKALLADAGSSAVLELTGPQITVKSGKPLSFQWAIRTEGAKGNIFEASLELLDESGSRLADSLLYRIDSRDAGDGPGLTRPWRSYTRAILVPGGVSGARVHVRSAPSGGRVWLGETALREGEGWLAYAATFSTHLGRHPEDKYVFTAGYVVQPDTTPSPSLEEHEAGLMLFERKGLVAAWPYAVPRPGDRVKILSEKVPRGTVAPFAFAVKALGNLAGVSAELTIPPSGANGSLKSKPVLYQGRYAATRLESSWSTVFGIRARLLEKPKVKPLPAGENLYYWLDLPVPKDASPGTYEGELVVRAEGHAPLKIPFRVEVVGVDLPPLPDSLVVGMYYYPPDDPQELEAQFRDMAAHGVYAISLSGSFVGKTPAGALRPDYDRLARLDRIMALMRRYGFYRPTALYVVDLLKKLDLPENADNWTEKDKQLFTSAIRLMDDTARQRGWCRLMFFPVDEPANNPEHMKLARLTLSLLRSMKGITPICDLNTPGSVEALADFLDAVVIQISSVNPHTLSLAREKHLKTFFYLPALGSADVGDDAAYHRTIPGWFLPRSGADGIYYFAYQSVSGDPYDELDTSHRDWCAAYPAPAPDYVWPAPEWQGIRRGIEDLRLTVLTRDLIQRCKAREDQPARAAGEAAQRRLTEILNTLKPSGEEVIYQLHNELETYISEKWRQELLNEVLGMKKAIGEK